MNVCVEIGSNVDRKIECGGNIMGFILMDNNCIYNGRDLYRLSDVWRYVCWMDLIWFGWMGLGFLWLGEWVGYGIEVLFWYLGISILGNWYEFEEGMMYLEKLICILWNCDVFEDWVMYKDNMFFIRRNLCVFEEIEKF